MKPEKPKTRRVFISYAHDDNHSKRTAKLLNKY
jgi:hypothetical protein